MIIQIFHIPNGSRLFRLWMIRNPRIQLLANGDIRDEQNPILCSSPMILSVLAEILELIQRAAPEHLPKEQEQPVDVPLLACHHRPHAAGLLAGPAFCKRWAHPLGRGTVVHHVVVRQNKCLDLIELGLDVECESFPAPAPSAMDLALY